MKTMNQKQPTWQQDFVRTKGVELPGDEHEVLKSLQNQTRMTNRDETIRDTTNNQHDNLMEKIVEKENMQLALKRVLKNAWSPWVDGITTEALKEHLVKHWPSIREKLLKGKYVPSPIRKVMIPKPDGWERKLGIPTTLDRLIQQAILQVLTPIYDPDFSPNSYGFRPNKRAHDAVKKAREYIEAGYETVVDMDIEKFFDTVNHTYLMNLMRRRIQDKRLLTLIGKYLKRGILIEGVIVTTEIGTPQGGPLSPLLANILLDVLDKELEKRGHHFCRYADDCNIYVKTERAGQRVLESIKDFIERELKLKLNKEKSSSGSPWNRKFLGFGFYKTKEGKIGIKPSEKSKKRLKKRLKELTGRSKPWDFKKTILKRLSEYTIGWISYYGLADMKGLMEDLDGWVRRRLRMLIWKRWKRVRTRWRNLRKLGCTNQKAKEYANTRKGYWRTSGSWIMTKTVTNKMLEKSGYKSMLQFYLSHRSM